MNLAASGAPAPPPPLAAVVFGEQLPQAVVYARHLATTGVEHGVIGPQEAGRVWQRHILNCAAVSAVVPRDAHVIDLGSGAGLPGIPLALARPDLRVTLLEPLARRVLFLQEVVSMLNLPVAVERGRAEDRAVCGDVVVARAVAPAERLLPWAHALLPAGGMLAALKGETVFAEIDSAGEAVTDTGADPLAVDLVSLTPTGLTVTPDVTAAGSRSAEAQERVLVLRAVWPSAPATSRRGTG